MRLDQWLWSVRLYRTRTLAIDAIKHGWVTVDGVVTKPAREVQPGQQIQARTGDITRTYRVRGHPTARVPAARVPEFAEDLTPPEALVRPRTAELTGVAVRLRGAGRPTKRDRRALERFRDET